MLSNQMPSPKHSGDDSYAINTMFSVYFYKQTSHLIDMFGSSEAGVVKFHALSVTGTTNNLSFDCDRELVEWSTPEVIRFDFGGGNLCQPCSLVYLNKKKGGQSDGKLKLKTMTVKRQWRRQVRIDNG